MQRQQQQQPVFAGKVVVVTGSSSGIGRDAALMFGREGAAGIVIHGQNAERLAETEKLLVEAGVDAAHILKMRQPKRILDATLAKFDRVDVLVNNAGTLQKPGCKDPIENLDFVYRVNLRSVVELTRLFMPELVKTKGCVVNVSSVAAQKTSNYASGANYGAMKAALDHFTKNFALAYGKKGVRVNCLSPGPVDTIIFERNGVVGAYREHFNKHVEEVTALGRWGTTAEMAECIKFLASPQSSYVTGTHLLADGGVLCYAGPPAQME